MKTIKKALFLAASLVMMISVMAITASAAVPPSTQVGSNNDQILGSATVTNSGVHFNGKTQTANVVVKDANGNTVDPKYYSLSGHQQKNTGKYMVTVTARAPYAGSTTATFEITAAPKKEQKADKKAVIKAKKTTVKASKKKTTTVKVKISSKKNKSKPVFTVTKGPKGKKGRKGITFKGKKIIFPKGAKKGTYKIKVTLPAYNKTKKITKVITIKVK